MDDPEQPEWFNALVRAGETSVRSSALVILLARWRERQAEYKAEWREAAARGRSGTDDRLAAADIGAEVGQCIIELEDLIWAGKKDNGKLCEHGGPQASANTGGSNPP